MNTDQKKNSLTLSHRNYLCASVPDQWLNIPPASRHRGFNFIEILFAVIILGLGFIMIAGIFPVALQQSNATANETTGALVARDAIRAIQNVAENSGANTLFAANAKAAPLTGSLLQAIASDSYFSSDRRFGWVAFYHRTNATDPYAQVSIVVLQNPNFADTNYALYAYPPPTPGPGPNPSGNTSTPICFSPTTPPTNIIAPGTFDAVLSYSASTGNSYIFLNNATIMSGIPVPNAVTGAFVLIAQDPGNPSLATASAAQYIRPADALTGRFFRLGTENPNLPGDVPTPAMAPYKVNWQVFQLQTGMDLKDQSEESAKAAFTAGTDQILPVNIVGRAPDTSGNFTGPNQDIAAISAFIRVNTSN